MAGSDLYGAVDSSTTVQAVLTTSVGATSAPQQPVMLAKCQGNPPTTTNVFAPGCLMQQTDTPTLYINTGTYASPVWTSVFSQGAYVILTATPVSWSGSGIALTASIAGVATTDLIMTSIKTKPTQAAYVASATTGTGNVTITLSASNTSNDAVIVVEILRPTV